MIQFVGVAQHEVRCHLFFSLFTETVVGESVVVIKKLLQMKVCTRITSQSYFTVLAKKGVAGNMIKERISDDRGLKESELFS